MDITDTGGSNSTKDQVSYPVDLMREVAAKILVDASMALDEHNQAWQKVQAFLDANPYVGSRMIEVLFPHQQRLSASYQWQIDFATALFNAVDLVSATDDNVAQTFQPKGSSGRGTLS